MASKRASLVVAAFSRRIFLILLHIFSIGFKSGLYGGRYFIVIFRILNFVISKLPLWAERLSIITVSPSLSTGSKDSVIYKEKMVLFTEPSKTMHCVEPSNRTDESIVVVFHAPGAESKHLLPFGDLPRKRTILVLADDSSIKTSLLMSHVFAHSSHSSRAFFISSLSCSDARSVFFYM